MKEGQFPEFVRGNADVRDLEGHSDHKSKICKVEIVGLLLFREIQSSVIFVGVPVIVVVDMRVMKDKNCVYENPGQHHTGYGYGR